jgi:phage replication-related protein YjqB (UPF0714/DUF867 family)
MDKLHDEDHRYGRAPKQEAPSPGLPGIVTVPAIVPASSRSNGFTPYTASPDAYRSFAELAAHERRNVDFRINASVRPSPVAIIAPHGGAIEPGTSELAQVIAGDNYSYYCFESIRPRENKHLHIASHRFDEPIALAIVQPAEVVVVLHGCVRPGECVWIGGLNRRLGELMRSRLEQAGIPADFDGTIGTSGRRAENLCNRGATGQGCQLEITHDLRKTLFEGLHGQGRRYRRRRCDEFAAAVRAAIATVVQ